MPSAGRRVYRTIKGSVAWHYCANCSDWPTLGFTEVESAGVPGGGHACAECQAKERAGKCNSITRPPVGRRVAVLDIRLPFRFKTFLQARPFEADLVRPHLEELRRDGPTGAEWRKLLDDHGLDSVWFQVYRQNPRNPVDHQVRHLHKRVDVEPGASPTPPPDEPSQRSGRSGLVVVTTYFPKATSARAESEIAQKTTDFLERLGGIPEVGKRVRGHGQHWAYRTVSARGEEYDDLDAVKKVFVPPRHSSSCGVTLDGGDSGGCGLTLPSMDSGIYPPPAPSPGPSPPAAPTSVTATAKCGAIRVGWSSALETITRYIVRTLDGAVVADLQDGTLTATDVSAPAGVDQQYQVTAWNAAGESPPSAPSNPARASGPPGETSITDCRTFDARVELEWAAPADDGGEPITANDAVAYLADGTPPVEVQTVSVGPTQKWVEFPGLTNGTRYLFVVFAVNTCGRGAGTTNLAITTPYAILGPPKNVVLSIASGGGLLVTWENPDPSPGTPVTAYRVTIDPAGQLVQVPATTTSYVFFPPQATPGATNTATVRALNPPGDESPPATSNPVTLVTVPDPPTSVTAVSTGVTSPGLRVTWQAPAVTGGSPLTGFEVKLLPGAFTRTYGSAVTDATLVPPDVTLGVEYTATVYAINSFGTSAGATSNSATPVGLPGPPLNVTAVAIITSGGVRVSWDPPVSNGGSPLVEYVVSTSPGATTVVVPAPTADAVLTALTNGVTYTFTVRAKNVHGGGALSDPSNPATPIGRPDSPTNVVATPGDGSAQVTWSAPAFDGGSPLTEYLIHASPSGTVVSIPPGATTAMVSPLPNGTPCSFTVSAKNIAGEGPLSGASNTVTPTRVNLGVQMTASADPLVADSSLTYTVVVSNLESTPVSNVQLVITRSPDTIGVSVSPSQGTYTGTHVITCELGTIAGGSSATVNVVVTPIAPTASLPASATVSTGVLDADPSDDSAVVTTAVVNAPGTVYIDVRDAALVPSAATLVQAGDTVQWNFLGPGVHSATDATGLGLFDSGPVSPVAYSRTQLIAAGTYAYVDSASAMTGTVEVPLQLSSVGPNIQVSWASLNAPAGYVYDVQVLEPGPGPFVDWEVGTTQRQRNYNPAVAGEYRFRSRLRNTANGSTSGWSPEGAITV